uniref:Major facilitator superfamily (MFS) profile domain-containing protein n=1 Tax=Lepeophtheirus salmonis TaxID=72036 RepID=A0A0K2UHE9_LEPSM
MSSINGNVITLDDFLQDHGEFGRYQAFVWFFNSIFFSLTAMQLMGWVFVGAELPHRCLLPNETLNASYHSISIQDIESIQCFIGNDSCSDSGFAYDESIVGDSVVKEWDLVCDESEKKSRVSAIVMVGYLIGSILFGSLPDKFGRKKILLIGVSLMFVSGCFTAFCQGYYSFLVSRALVGITLPVVETTLMVMGIELVGPSKRTLAGIGQWFFESFGLLLTALIAFLVNSNWRILQIIYTAPLCLIGVYYWTTPESPRWLLSKGRCEEATSIMEKVIKSNGHNIEYKVLLEKMKSISKSNENASASYNYWDLFKFPSLRIKIFVLSILWTTISAIYYVILLDQQELSENIYIGFLITAVVQIPGYVILIQMIQHPRLGRKMSLIIMLILSGSCLCIHPFLYFESDLPWIRIVVSTMGRFGANCYYSILVLFTSEIYPTVMRNTGISLNYFISRFGCILAPYVLLLGKYSSIIFGALSILSGFLTILLPETNGMQLPDTVEESENIKINFSTFGKKKLNDK